VFQNDPYPVFQNDPGPVCPHQTCWITSTYRVYLLIWVGTRSPTFCRLHLIILQFTRIIVWHGLMPSVCFFMYTLCIPQVLIEHFVVALISILYTNIWLISQVNQGSDATYLLKLFLRNYKAIWSIDPP
jgi:hypothetical protein